METEKSGLIMKVSKGDIIEIADKELTFESENIISIAGKVVNENGDKGISFI